ncbi:MAG: indole-3-glycerol phosphate synthase TrpC [Clostridium sp.]|jgi:indole-3-glycerol phosphate synthase|nr:indole-3-glycerol phosphate synthase TrpC [Clostridium sp.]
MKPEGILQKIAQKTHERIAEEKRSRSLGELRSKVADLECETFFPFERAMWKNELSFICEVKKASPSKGVIAHDFDYTQIAKEYETAGADAISVLTEPYFFLGADAYLSQIRALVTTPILRKDFTIDEYMIYQAKLLGADAVLLICSLLTTNQLQEYLEIAKSIGLSSLVEVHDATEIEQALDAKASMIGVNNRSLNDFSVDTNNTKRLRAFVPNDVLLITESGVSNPADIRVIRNIPCDGVLIGEALMRSSNKTELLREFRMYDL